MIFKLKDLYHKQFELDEDIQQKHNVTYQSTREKRFLAFVVELGELANATRCFKFRSYKESETKNRLLDEYADGLHFLLSIGIDFDYTFEEINYFDLDEDLTTAFLICYNLFNEFISTQSVDSYIQVMSYFLSMMSVLGFTSDEVMGAYMAKLMVNHKRQETNY